MHPDVQVTNQDRPNVVEVNGQNWFHDDEICKLNINGPTSKREWSIKVPVGNPITKGSNTDKHLSRLDVFLIMFPPKLLVEIVRFTNAELERNQKKRLLQVNC